MECSISNWMVIFLKASLIVGNLDNPPAKKSHVDHMIAHMVSQMFSPEIFEIVLFHSKHQ